MTAPGTRTPRRSDALSRERIVAAAIELLDADGEEALTVRALTARLTTGRGAIYHHVSGMDALLAAAVDQAVEQATRQTFAPSDNARADVRALALCLFDAIDAHPWVGTQLSREPLQPAVFRIWKSIGAGLNGLGLTGAASSDAGAALTSYILGAAAQFAAGPRRTPDPAARQAYLDSLAAAWIEQDAEDVVRDAASQLRSHDDRAQFLAGIDIFLAGIAGAAP